MIIDNINKLNQHLIIQESIKNGKSKEQLRKEVLDYLEEIAMDKKMYVIRWMGIVFLKICFMMKIGVFVNEPAVLKVTVTVVFFFSI